jgi:hypothetical protein
MSIIIPETSTLFISKSLKMKGKQPRGRPRIRWTDQIRRDIEMRGVK